MVVCRPRPHLSLTSPVLRSSDGSRAVRSDDFPTPDCPTATVKPLPTTAPSSDPFARHRADETHVVAEARPNGHRVGEQRTIRDQVDFRHDDDRRDRRSLRRHEHPVDEAREKRRLRTRHDDEHAVRIRHHHAAAPAFEAACEHGRSGRHVFDDHVAAIRATNPHTVSRDDRTGISRVFFLQRRSVEATDDFPVDQDFRVTRRRGDDQSLDRSAALRAGSARHQ